MPAIVFTAAELFGAAVDRMHDLSEQVLALSDLERTPLAPGESPDARRHKIAKAGKQLAEAFVTFEKLVDTAHDRTTSGTTRPEPTSTDTGTN